MPQMVPDANVGDKTLLTIILRLYSDRNLSCKCHSLNYHMFSTNKHICKDAIKAHLLPNPYTLK